MAAPRSTAKADPARSASPTASLFASSDEEKHLESQSIEVSSSAESEQDFSKFYEPPDSYESKHRWDPRATWTEAEAKCLLRKIDVRVTLVACICFGALNLDRYNITNALSDGLLNDIGLNTGDYNLGQTIFYLCFLFAELPSQMISKKLGSDVWIPIQMMSWSAVAIGQVGLSGKASFFVTRGLLGLIEGGFIADTVLYLSYYFTANELTIRLAFFWFSYTITNILASFLAAGLLQIRHLTGIPGWKWLFGIEGALTFLIGLFAFFYLPAGPTQTAGGIRGKGWFTEREEVIIVNKVLRDDPTKSSMHNRQGLSLRDLWLSFTDFDLWPLYIVGLVNFIAPATINAYFTLTLRSLKFSTFQTNLLIIPSQVITLILVLGIAYLSKLVNERILVSSATPWWLFIFILVLTLLPDSTDKWVKWAILTLILGYPYSHPIFVSMTSANAGSVRTRTVASSLYNMFVQAGTLVGQNVYQPGDAPFYHRGNRVLLGILALDIVLFWAAKAWYVWRNRQRERVWDAWTQEEREHYLATTTDKGNKRLDFRFKH